MKTILNNISTKLLGSSLGLLLGAGVTLCVTSSCSDWLAVEPGDSQVAESYWSSKADVDNMLMGGYSYLRSTTESYLIPYGEVRAGLVYHRSASKLQQLNIVSTLSLTNWSSFYKIVNVANVVLNNAHKVQKEDPTYTDPELNSHLCEAYFLRALAYFYLVRNWRDVPIVTEGVEDDSKPFLYAKSPEADVIAQIKSDIRTALATGAAKEEYETTWETKGRATKWALNALMADVCLWSGDYQDCIDYCEGVLGSQSTKAPRLLTDSSRSTWYSMFNPGNSKESIFEIQWNYEEDQTNNLCTLFRKYGAGSTNTSDNYRVSPVLLEKFAAEYDYCNEEKVAAGEESSTDGIRTLYSSVVPNSAFATGVTSDWGYVYKYSGMLVGHTERSAEEYDPNYIIYRCAELYLMEAEAYAMLDNYEKAVELINVIRTRAAAEPKELTGSESQVDILQMILDERFLEFVGEGKAWYDLLRMGRRSSTYRKELLIQNVIDYSVGGTNLKETTIKNILNDDGLCFLPIYASELEHDSLLVQNPSYKQ